MMKQIRLLAADRLLHGAYRLGAKYWSNEVIHTYANLLQALLKDCIDDNKTPS